MEAEISFDSNKARELSSISYRHSSSDVFKLDITLKDWGVICAMSVEWFP